MGLVQFIKSKKSLSVFFSVIATVLFVFATVQAATTISTDVTTGGSVYATSTLAVDGLSVLGNASTTNVSISSNFMVNGNATTTGTNGNISTGGTLTVTGTADVTGLTTLVNATTTVVSVSSNLTVNGNATTTGATGAIATQGSLDVSGTTTLANASSTSFTTTGDLWVNGYATTTSANGNIETNGTLSIASSTVTEQLNVTGDMFIGSSGTTTIFMDSTGTDSQAACLQMRGSDGTTYRAYLVATTSAQAVVGSWQIEAGTCQ